MQPIPTAQVGALVNQYRFRLKAKCIGSVDVHHVLHSLFQAGHSGGNITSIMFLGLANMLMWQTIKEERVGSSNIGRYRNTINIMLLLPPYRFIGLNSKISPIKVDDEWWNNFGSLQKYSIFFLEKGGFPGLNFGSLQKYSINALIFLKQLCLPMH